MINFARMGHLELECVNEEDEGCLGGTKSPLPQMPTLWDEISELFQYTVQQRGGLMGTLLLKDENGEVSILTLLCVYLLPILLLYGVYRLMWSPFTTEAGTAERTRALEEKNKTEKAKIDQWLAKHPSKVKANGKKKWD